jgi:carboxylesterase
MIKIYTKRNKVKNKDLVKSKINQPLMIRGNTYGVLLLHGFTSGPHEMKPVSDALLEIGYSVSIPLLPGHGSTPKDLLKCTWYDWFNGAKESFFELKKKCNKIIVIGQSMGGTLALHLAAHYQFEGVIALAPGLFFKERKTKLLFLVSKLFRYRKKVDGPDIHDEQERMNQKFYSYDKTPLKAAYQLKLMFDHVIDDLPEISVPVFLIHSTQDHVIDYKSSVYIYDKISSEQKEILMLNESYHVLTLDLEKDKVIKEIKKFITDAFKT